MYWMLSYRADPRALPLADRHYNRQKPGSSQFVPPGRCIVLLTRNEDALWVSSWPFTEFCHHEWAGAWMCTCFRNESPILSSLLIREAVAITRMLWGEPPALGMVSFVNPKKIRKKRDPGRCFKKAGFSQVGMTKKGLIAFKMEPWDMPEPATPAMGPLFTDQGDL
jgi:hypothetical protein